MRNFEKKCNPNIKVNYEVNYEDKVYEDILIKKIAAGMTGRHCAAEDAGVLCQKMTHWEKSQMK